MNFELKNIEKITHIQIPNSPVLRLQGIQINVALSLTGKAWDQNTQKPATFK